MYYPSIVLRSGDGRTRVCLDCSTNFIDYGQMITLFLVPLFVVVVLAVLFSKPFLCSFSHGTAFLKRIDAATIPFLSWQVNSG